jgi:hypothetical protein
MDLIEQLEKATGPDRVLDVEIGCEISGLSRNYFESAIAQAKGEWEPDEELWPRYTSSIDVAATLLPNDDHHWKCGYSKHVRHNAEVVDMMHPHNGVFVGEHDHSRAIALCIAALKSRANKR